jgi:hypothetical protein
MSMKCIMLIYESPADLESRKDAKRDPYVAAWRAYYKTLVAAGVYVSGQPLKAGARSTTVRLKDGKRHVQDGPFAEAKERLGGFIILDVPSLDTAFEWAARCPATASGAVEVLPIDVDFHDIVVAP